MFYTLLAVYFIYEFFGPDIRAYFWNKKTPKQKYIAFRKARADYNHKNGIVDEYQYDYLLGFNDGHQQE